MQVSESKWILSVSSELPRYFVAVLLCAVVTLCTASCTRDRTTAQTQGAPADAPSASSSLANDGLRLTIFPASPNRKSAVTLSPEGFSIQDAHVIWYVDGAPTASVAADQFDCSDVPRGASIRAIAKVSGREVESNMVTIGNTPPEITDVQLVPAMTGRDETLAVTVDANDVDNDPVTIQYVWMVNDVLAGNGPTLICPLRRGDRVRVEISASDGREYGERMSLNHTVANHPPMFVEQQGFSFSGNTFTYQAQATDADGDRLSYGLEGAAEGMTIDRDSGRLTWSAPSGFLGDQPVTITADDGHGGVARYTITFTVKE
jgi:hypothetical protein